MSNFIEDSLEKSIFASRWFLAPIYIVLSISLFFITIKVVQEFFHFVPLILTVDLKGMMLFVLHIVDLALVGNLVLMIIFAGYENFVSKISIADDSEDKPSWMGKVDFSELKLKLIASMVAISDREFQWMIIIHVVFIFSGVLLAMMDFIASKSNSH